MVGIVQAQGDPISFTATKGSLVEEKAKEGQGRASGIGLVCVILPLNNQEEGLKKRGRICYSIDGVAEPIRGDFQT